MKIVRFLLCGVVLTLLFVGRTARADGWSLGKLNPFEKQQAPPTPSYETPSQAPSPLRKFNDGAKKLVADTSAGTKKLVDGTAAGTKRFFVGAKDMLTWKKSTTKARPISPYGSWQHEIEPQKRSWLSSLFRREEPKPAKDVDEFLSLDRPEF